MTCDDGRQIPSYQLLIDWDNDDGINAGNFEFSTGLWIGGGTGPATVAERSTDRSHLGSASLLVSWQTGTTTPRVQSQRPDLWIVGETYTLSAWVWVPTGSPGVSWRVHHLGTSGPVTTVFDSWVQMTYTFTATAVGGVGDVWIIPNGAGATGQYVYVDDILIYLNYEDLWDELNWGSSTDSEAGRDQARSISPTRIGTLRSVLNNPPTLDECGQLVTPGRYWPENEDSPLYGLVRPARGVRFEANFRGTPYLLFSGKLDKFDLTPNRYTSELDFSANDIMAFLTTQSVSTELYSGLTSGQAIEAILDNIGWPTELRDIDYGSLVIPWFWAEGDNALNAILDIVNSEGPPSLLTTDNLGRIVFKDRHHALFDPRCVTTQTVIKNTGTENQFVWPLEYDHGWRDIINTATYDIDVRVPEYPKFIWDSGETVYSIQDTHTRSIRVSTSDPFYDAIVPVENIDYYIISGAVSITLSRTSGVSVDINITAVGGAAQLVGLKLRATPVPVLFSTNVSGQDAASASEFGVKNDPIKRPWLSENEAIDMVDLVLGMFAARMPILKILLKGINDTTFYTMLDSLVRDRIRITDATSAIDFECFVEQIQHSIENNTLGDHSTILGSQRVPVLDFVPFTLDVSVLDTDKLSIGGTDTADEVFTLSSGTIYTDTAPIFIAQNETNWDTTAATKSLRISTSPGDIVVVIGQSVVSTTTLSTPTGNGITFNLDESSTAASNPAVYLWSGTDADGGVNWTLEVARAAGTDFWGFAVLVFRHSSGVGDTNLAGPAVGAPSVGLTTTTDNSAIVVFSSDYAFVDGRARTWLSVEDIVPTQANKYERTYNRNIGYTTVYGAYYPSVGTTGAKTVGLSAPTGQQYTTVAIEICSRTSTQNPNMTAYEAVLGSAYLGH